MTHPPTTYLPRTRLRDALCSAVATLLSNIWGATLLDNIRKVISGTLSGGKASACSLLAAALFAFGPPPASAQQPGPGEEVEEQAPQEHVLRDQALRKRLEGLPAAEREALLRRRRGQAGQALSVERKATSSAEAKLEQTDADLVTRAAAGLTGVGGFGSATSIVDVDNDGNADLLIAGEDENGAPSTTLYLGAGGGTFQEAGANLTGVGGSLGGPSTSIADVDNDGNPDLLITGITRDGGSATLYLGNGDGTFQEANADLAGVSSSATSTADINGDGNEDLLIAGRDKNGRSATLYLGAGDGSFQEAGASLSGVRAGATSIADVDGDGNQDLLITGQDANLDPTATLYLGDGQGGFSEAGAGLAGVASGPSTSIADVDNDGSEDLLITGSDGTDPTATLYLGAGDGSFQEANAGLTGASQGATSIADVDGDGNEDLLITGDDENFEESATLYLGAGDGTFQEADAGLTGVRESATSIADIDSDGDEDLLITGDDALFREVSARLYVNRTEQEGPNHAPRLAETFEEDTVAAGTEKQWLVEAGDPDGDRITIEAQGPGASVEEKGNGVAEVTFAPSRDLAGQAPEIGATVTDPDGSSASFTRRVEVPARIAAFSAGLTGVSSSGTSIADVDGDGNQDLVIAGFDGTAPTTTLYLGAGDGSFQKAGAGLTGTSLGSVSTADADNDGNEDLLVTGNAASVFNPDPTATLYLGSGDGSFQEAQAGLAGVNFGAASIADVDGDGNQDLLIVGNAGTRRDPDLTATLYLGAGDGTFQEANAGLTGVGSISPSTSIADVDNDGNQDLLITGITENGQSATLYLGAGDGTFQEANAGLAGAGEASTSIADVNGDGNPDLLIAGITENGRSTTLYLGSGDGSFQEAKAGLAGVGDGATSIADVDGDGNEDLLVTGRDDNIDLTATLYLGDGNGSFRDAGVGLTGAGGRLGGASTSIADVDGDGDEDLLITGFGENGVRTALLYENLFQNPLPVELAGFSATADGKTVRLTWQTASETNNAGFRVQRRVGEGGPEPGKGSAGASDGQAWTTVGRVEGGGTTTEARSYQFTDVDLPYAADALTYRLRQVDTDGSVSYSDPITVERGVAELELIGTYPNPARREATVRYALPERQEVRVRLYDVLGRKVRTVAYGEQKGRQERTFDVGGLSSGVYFLRLRAEGKVRTERMTVVR